MQDDNTRNPWDQLPEESTKAYRGFCVYLQLGPERSIAKAYHSIHGNESRAGNHRWFEQWSSDYRWVERVRAWEAQLLQQANQDCADLRAEIIVATEQAALKAVQRISDDLDLKTSTDDKEVPMFRDVTNALNSLTATLQRLTPATPTGRAGAVTSVSVTVDLHDTDHQLHDPALNPDALDSEESADAG